MISMSINGYFMSKIKKIRKLKALDEISSPNFARRFVSGLLDYILTIIIACFLFAFVAQPIAKTNPTYNANVGACQTIMLESGLYEEKNSDIVKIYNADHTNPDIDASVTAFYIKYDNVQAYEDYKKQQVQESVTPSDRLFVYNEGTNLFDMIEEKTNTPEMKEWLSENVDNALVNVLQNTSEWKSAYVGMFSSIVLLVVIVYLTSALVFYLIIPLCLSGRTIGHKLMGLRMYSIKTDDIRPTAFQTTVRFLAFTFLNLILGVFTFGIVPLISLFIALNTSKESYIHGLVSGTTLVDYQEKKTEELDSFAKKALHLEEDNYDKK